MTMKDYLSLADGGPGLLEKAGDAVPIDCISFVPSRLRRYRMKCQKCGGKPARSGPESMTCEGCGHTSGELADFREQVLNPDTADGTW